jgi:hypothetical protein
MDGFEGNRPLFSKFYVLSHIYMKVENMRMAMRIFAFPSIPKIKNQTHTQSEIPPFG